MEFQSDSILSKDDIITNNKKNISFVENDLGMVSIIICNHNGYQNLARLFISLKKCRFYNNYEIIIVDNSSSDESIEYLKQQRKYFNIKIIQNDKNESFSKACNQGARMAEGIYLLFLNNDIVVTDGWLDELLEVAKNKSNVGAIGARLIYPQIPDGKVNSGKSYLAQHKGIHFSYQYFKDKIFLKPYNKGNGENPLDKKNVTEIAAVTAACLLIRKSVFFEIMGFDEHYVYGYEDVDLCLKAYRKGYKNFYCSSSLLFHYEFGTQEKNSHDEVSQRREKNLQYFTRRWGNFIKRELFYDKINRKRIFTNKKLTISFAVTDSTETTTAGDYFTALELANSLKRYNINVKYLNRKGSEDWYDVGIDTDVLISMLDSYDLHHVRNSNPNLITIAWARNWFTRWCHNPSIQEYTFIFASSKMACEYFFNNIGRVAELFPIATNFRRFEHACNEKKKAFEMIKYKSDYVFTGSYWNDKREIIDALEPEELPYKFKIWGANWDNCQKLAPYSNGFIEYKDIHLVYKYTKIVIDDANQVTKSWGAVNSRVYDGIASGCLVLTNGKKGSEEIFDGKLPVYNTKDDLKELLNFYLTNENKRYEKIKELQEIVKKYHTYDNRANFLISILKRCFSLDTQKIAIMIPVPNLAVAESWGDYHFAVAMKKIYEQNGYIVQIRCMPEWNIPFNGKYVITLRGLCRYFPTMEHVNILWNISHPNDIQLDEYDEYDIAYISSILWADYLKKRLRVRVETLMQCTNLNLYTNNENITENFDILFVGNSRGIYRKVISDLLPTKWNVAIYGKGWEPFVDKKYIKGQLIPNKMLKCYYKNSKILLNDHWHDMKEKGFISNRIFDGLAAGAFVISDNVNGINNILKGCVVTYNNRKDLHEKVDYYMTHPIERAEIAQKGHKVVLKYHTFTNRVRKILSFMNNFKFYY